MGELFKASFFKKLQGEKVECFLCHRNCKIEDGKRGVCGVRKNIGGELFSLVYGKTVSMQVDPIEKKPLFHFKPGTSCMSISTFGCNFSCVHCFPEDTFIVSDSGIKKISDFFEAGKPIQGNNEMRDLADFYAVNHKGRFNRIVHAFKHSYSGNIVCIKPNHSPEFKCTPEHELFAFRKETKTIEKVRADSLKKGDFLVIPKPKAFRKKKIFLDIAGLFEKRKVEVKSRYWRMLPILEDVLILKKKGFSSRQIGEKFGMSASQIRNFFSKLRRRGKEAILKETFGVVAKDGFTGFKWAKSKVNSRIPLDPDFAKLLGYYCAEGSITKLSKRPNSYSVAFSFSKNERRYADEVKNLTNKLFGVQKFNQTVEGNSLQLKCSTSILGMLLELLCGSGAKNKRVPYFLFHADKKTVKAFLQAYCAGDGWVGENHPISIDTVSKELALGVYWLFLKIGLLPSFYEWKPKSSKFFGRTKRVINQSTLYYVKLYSHRFRKKFLESQSTISKKTKASEKFIEKPSYFLVPIRKMSNAFYSGPVYNLEVNQEHSYLANFVAVANCQNYEQSQMRIEDQILRVPFTSPEKIVQETIEAGAEGIAYTYNEPTIFAEYALETMKIAKEKGLYNVWVSNGYMSRECAEEIAPFLDAINVDLKGSQKFYLDVCGNANIGFVKENIKFFHEKGVHLEIAYLIIPGQNDREKDFKEAAEFIAGINKKIPLHFSRFFPKYKMAHLPATDYERMEFAKKTAEKAGLEFVFLGNIGNEENSFCPNCKNLLIKRIGYSSEKKGLDKKGNCAKCGFETKIIP